MLQNILFAQSFFIFFLPTSFCSYTFQLLSKFSFHHVFSSFGGFFCVYFFFLYVLLNLKLFIKKKEPQIWYIQIVTLFMILSVLATLFSPGYLYCQALSILLYSSLEHRSSLECNSSRIIIINSYVLSLFCSYLTKLLPE